MRQYDCPCEQDVLDSLATRRWPSRCDEELRLHVASCRTCADLVEAVAALLDESLGPEAPAVPPAGVVWWRAQLRARQEAARAAARPLRLAVQVAVSCALVAVAFGLVTIAPTIRSALPDVASWIPVIDTQAARETAAAALASRGVQLAAAAWLVLGPVAVYLALADD